VRHRAKFYADQSSRSGDMSDFLIFQNGGSSLSWIFKSLKLYPPGCFTGPICIIMPNFVPIGQTVAGIWLFFDFSKMAAVRHIGFVLHVLGPRRVFDGLCNGAKFGWNWCSSFINMQVLIFCPLGMKMSIHSPKLGFLGI